MPMQKGDSLMVTHSDGNDYPAKVIDVGPKGVKVHYTGWKKSWCALGSGGSRSLARLDCAAAPLPPLTPLHAAAGSLLRCAVLGLVSGDVLA